MRPRGSEDIDDDLGLLNGAIELAVVRARQDAGASGAPPPPSALRPVLRFTRLPTRALRTVHDVLDRDDDFRARVAEGAVEDDIGRASWLFLVRPEGWNDELELLRSAAVEEEAEVTASRQEQTAERRLTQVEETLARVRDELRDAVRSGETAERSLAAERATRLRLEHDHTELAARVDRVDAERARAVRSLKELEARAVTRLEELRVARSRVAEFEQRIAELETRVQPQNELDEERTPATTPAAGGTVPIEPAAPIGPSPWEGTDPAAVAAAVERAAAAAATLGAALDEAARSLTSRRPPVAPDGLGADDLGSDGRPLSPSVAVASGAASGAARGPRPPRRTPIRLRRGVHEGTPEGLEQLLATPEVVVIVDGYNVSMEAWPSLDSSGQRSSLVAMLGGLQSRCGGSFHVVFDGDDEGRRPSVAAPLPVRVHFSHAEVEADDVVLDMVARLPTDRPVVVVSSDRRVQDGARRLGANVVRSSELLALTRT